VARTQEMLPVRDAEGESERHLGAAGHDVDLPSASDPTWWLALASVRVLTERRSL